MTNLQERWDEITLKIAQDRAALLRAAKYVMATCPCDPEATPRFERAWADLAAAVGEAERPATK